MGGVAEAIYYTVEPSHNETVEAKLSHKPTGQPTSGTTCHYIQTFATKHHHNKFKQISHVKWGEACGFDPETSVPKFNVLPLSYDPVT